MLLRSIAVQFALEALLFTGVLLVTAYPAMRRREPRKVLALFSALNVLRFGGVAGALAALHGSPMPAFLVQVAVGDGIAATLAVVALARLLRRSKSAARAFAWMNALGLAGILVSEAWLQCAELGGAITRTGFVHGPTIGAALYAALHAFGFHVLVRSGRRDGRPDAGTSGVERLTGAMRSV